MPSKPLIFPFGGRLDSTAHSEHPELYSRSMRNCRGRDPRTGRMRGGSRSGMTKFNPSAIGVGRIRALCSTAIDDRKLTYAFSSGAVTTDWRAITPTKTDSRAGRVDRQGNVYALDGNAGIVKLNSRGVEIMKIALPVADPSHVVRALWVDESDRIFAGVSEGGDVRTARVFMVLQLPENQFQVLWSFEPGAYTEDLRVYRGSLLFAAHNYPLENRSRVIVYENLSLDPTEASRIEDVAYPINGFDLLADDGAVYCTSKGPTQAIGPSRPGHPGLGDAGSYHQQLVSWKPTDLVDAAKRIWSWYDSEEIDETDVSQGTRDVAELADGDSILRWRDKSGNGRHFFAGNLLIANESGPTYLKVGIGGRPSVRFTNRVDGAVTTRSSLVTLGNASIDPKLAAQQRTALPTYQGSQFCLFMVIRPSIDADAGTPSPRTVLAQENEHATASDHVLFVNRNCQAAPLPGAVAAGFISYYATTDNTGDAGQCAATPQSLGFDFAGAGPPDRDPNDTGTVLVTILWDGGVDPNDSGATRTRCLVRYNGVPVDRFEGLPLESLQPTWLGLSPTTIFATGEAVARRLNGEIGEMLVLVRKDIVGTTEPKVASFDALEAGSGNVAQTENDITRVEGYLAYKWGVGSLLPNDAFALTDFQHPFGASASSGILPGPPRSSTGSTFTPFRDILYVDNVVTKHDAQGALQWSLSADTLGVTADTIGGIGYGIVARKVESDSKVHVYLSGPDALANVNGTGNVAVRKVIDQGTAVSTASADGAWLHRYATNPELDYAFPKLAADEFGNLFLPGNDLGAAIRGLTIFGKDGDGSGLGVVRHTEILPGSADLAFACALPPDDLNPDYRSDIASPIAEFVHVFTTLASAGSENAIHKLRLVTATSVASGSPRTIVTLAASATDIRQVTESTNIIPTGGAGVLDGTAQFLQCFRAGDDIVVLDGVNVWAFKLRDGEVERLVATSAGEVPQRPKLGMFWRHRLVLGALADNPDGYVASKLGDIRDWDLRINQQTSSQAFAGSATRAGEAEDSLVAMIPVWDDLAFLVCESRILRLTGDPQDNGNIHKVTDSMGGTWDAWCKDATGRVFIFGNAPPGLYMLRPTDDPVPLSRHTLEESEFEDINFATHRILLAWNPIDRGVHIFQVAWADPATIVSHWFWEEKTHRFVRQPPIWTDKIGSASLQPTAVAYLGEDDTRGLLIGCADGFIRKWDPEAATDDGTIIDSFATIGPITPSGGPKVKYRLLSVKIALADDQSGVTLQVFGGDTADEIGPLVFQRDLKPGLNIVKCRVKERVLWMRLRNANATRWSYEDGEVELEVAGKAREGSEVR